MKRIAKDLMPFISGTGSGMALTKAATSLALKTRNPFVGLFIWTGGVVASIALSELVYDKTAELMMRLDERAQK